MWVVVWIWRCCLNRSCGCDIRHGDGWKVRFDVFLLV